MCWNTSWYSYKGSLYEYDASFTECVHQGNRIKVLDNGPKATNPAILGIWIFAVYEIYQVGIIDPLFSIKFYPSLDEVDQEFLLLSAILRIL